MAAIGHLLWFLLPCLLFLRLRLEKQPLFGVCHAYGRRKRSGELVESTVPLSTSVHTGIWYSAHIPLAKACHMAKQERGVNISHRTTTSLVTMDEHIPFHRKGGSKYLRIIVQSTMEYILRYMVCKSFNLALSLK